MNAISDISVLASIHSKWCKKIFDGEKLVEIRKSRPKLEPPFKMYIYCTKPSKTCQTISGSMVINTDELFRLPDGALKHDWSGELMVHPSDAWGPDNYLNGKVIGECVCDKIDAFQVFEDGRVQNWLWLDLDRACISYETLAEYVGAGKTGYAWHLSRPALYDKPLPITDFLPKPPQSWCYVSAPRTS